jgi:hypothetical protein
MKYGYAMGLHGAFSQMVKNDHFFEIKQKSPKQYLIPKKEIFSHFKHIFVDLGEF